MWKGRIAHRASLTQFLFFCKRLPSEQFPFGHLNPKAVRSRVAFIRLARDYARYARTVAAFIGLAMIRLMLRRLTRQIDRATLDKSNPRTLAHI
jgi:hypothetical protein